MIDKNLLQEAHNKKIINKKHVLWWQLDFDSSDYVVYWKINEEKQKQVRKSLIDRLGKNLVFLITFNYFFHCFILFF